MIGWLGIGHLFEHSPTEAVAAFTPLVVFAVFFLAQLTLPGRSDSDTGSELGYRSLVSRNTRLYKLNSCPVDGVHFQVKSPLLALWFEAVARPQFLGFIEPRAHRGRPQDPVQWSGVWPATSTYQARVKYRIVPGLY